MNGHFQYLAKWLAISTFILTSCGGEPGIGSGIAVDESGPAFQVTGKAKGDFFYPRFQRWRIIKVTPIAGAKVPIDAGGIPAILRGRSIYLNAGYMTVPFLNAEGDLLSPACFRYSEQGVEVQPVKARKGVDSKPMMLRNADGNRLLLAMYDLFELTLERSKLPPDEGYQQRTFDAHFNKRLAAEMQGGASALCELTSVSLRPLTHRDLELHAPATGRRIVLRGADLDPETLLTAGGQSHEWRRKLDATLPINTVAGCVGQVFVIRLLSGDSEENQFRTEYRIIGSLFGQSANGEICGRVKFLRRIEPEKVLELFGIPASQGVDRIGQRPGIHLVSWVGDGVFRAKIGGSEFELTVLDQPQILVGKLNTDLGVSATHPSNKLPPAPPPRSVEPGAEPDPAPENQIHKWVDEHGVVHYSDRPGGQ